MVILLSSDISMNGSWEEISVRNFLSLGSHHKVNQSYQFTKLK